MICFLTHRAHAYTLRALQDDPVAPEVTALSYDEGLVKPALPRATYIFTDLDRLSTHDLIEAARLYRRLQEHGCRVLNDPALVRTRFALLRALHREGLNPINAYLIAENARPGRFPVFLRVADGHDGPISDLIPDQEELDRAIEAAAVTGIPLSALLIVEYAAEPVRPGVFGKSSLFRIGDRFVPDLWWYGTSWNIKGDHEGLVANELYQEELEAIRNNSYAQKLAGAFMVANVDYGRLDFSLVDGKPCIYEINTNPMLFGPRPHPLPNRAESIALKWTKFVDALSAIDTEQDAPEAPIDVAGTSVKALTEAGAQYPAFALHDLRLSREYQRRGDLPAALEHAKTAVAANPHSPKALSQLSRILMKRNRVDEAIAAAKQAIALNPRSAGDRRHLASLLLKTGHPQEAREQLQAALAFGANHWQIHLLLSEACRKLGEPEAARDAAMRASELAPNEPSVAKGLQRLRRSPLQRWQARYAQLIRRLSLGGSHAAQSAGKER